MEHNLKNFSFDQITGKHAKEQFTIWHFSKEWRLGIIILTIVKVVTWIISIYAGYYFLFKITLPVVEKTAVAGLISVVMLMITEFLTWVALSKSYKFMLKRLWQTAVFSGIIALGIYSLSFYITTNGLAMRQADKIDKTEVIVDNSSLEVEQIKQNYAQRITDYRTEIATIKANPNGWINGKAKRLTVEQLRDIKAFNLMIDSLGRAQKTEIAAIKDNKDTELSTNLVNTTAEANKYHNIVVVVMIVQAICNFLLMFSWSRIFDENDNLANIREDLTRVKNTLIYNFFQDIGATILDDANTFILSQQHQKKEIPFEIVNTQPAQVIGFAKTEVKTETPTPNIGFRQQPTPPQEPQVNSKVLGKLRTNDMLRYVVKKKADGEIEWPEKKILSQCGVKKWKLYEFQNLMISANLINEPKKYTL